MTDGSRTSLGRSLSSLACGENVRPLPCRVWRAAAASSADTAGASLRMRLSLIVLSVSVTAFSWTASACPASRPKVIRAVSSSCGGPGTAETWAGGQGAGSEVGGAWVPAEETGGGNGANQGYYLNVLNDDASADGLGYC